MTKASKIYFGAALAFLIGVSSAAAAEDVSTWEVQGATNLSFSHSTDKTNAANIEFAPGTSNSLSLSTSVSYFLMPQFELGLAVSMVSANSAGQGFSNIKFGPVATYDFSADVANSFFLIATVGPLFVNDSSALLGGNYGTFMTWAYVVGAGRRVEIVKHVTWTPEIGLQGNTSTTKTDPVSGSKVTYNATLGYFITPLQLSVLF